MPSNRNRIHSKRTAGSGKLALLAAGATLALGGTATALAADVPVLDRNQLELSLDTAETRQQYHDAYDQAQRFNVEPGRNIATGVARAPELEVELAALNGQVANAKAKQKVEEESEPKIGTPESVGVSQATLESIAACESGGDPTVVDASGTYHGKYQFDVGTWASVGGSGLPSEAPEAEQDYRAALLYSQSGSTPWPVCG